MASDKHLLLVEKTSYYGIAQMDPASAPTSIFNFGFNPPIILPILFPYRTLADFKSLLKALLDGKNFVDIYRRPTAFQAVLKSTYLEKIVEIVKGHNNSPLIIESDLQIKEMKVVLAGKLELESLTISQGVGSYPLTFSFGATANYQTIWSEGFESAYTIDINAVGRNLLGSDVNVELFSPTIPAQMLALNNSHLRVKLEWTANLEWSTDDPKPPPKRIKMENDLAQVLFDEDDSKKDFSIFSGDGFVMKCHRNVLSARSKWFEKMFENPERVEVKTGKRTLTELSGEGLKLFMKFLYGLEIPAGEMTPRLALQLLQNGHIYELPELVETISAFLLGKDVEWFGGEAEVNSFLELYLFMSKLEGDTQTKLTSHLLQILAWIPAEKVKESQSYQKLDKDSAIDLISKMHETVMKGAGPK